MWQNTKRVFLDSVERVLSAAAQLLPSDVEQPVCVISGGSGLYLLDASRSESVSAR